MGASLQERGLEREAEISIGGRKVRGILVLPLAIALKNTAR